MAIVHVRQIEGHLKPLFERLDSADIKGSAEHIHTKLLSRALAAFAVAISAEIAAEEACAFVTDGFHDNGIDLIHYDPNERVLYLVQSKWHADGRGSIDQGDALKFIEGVRRLITNELAGFNEKIQARQGDIESALFDAGARFVLVIAHTGQERLSAEVSNSIGAFLDSQNDTSELFSLRVLNQSDLHRAALTGISGEPIRLDVQLNGWGQQVDPHYAVYGRVCAADVAGWSQFGHHLFEPNLRRFLGGSSVNSDLVETLLNRPKDFWYFNNGITAISASVKKKPIGGNSNDVGIFECADFFVVNGAQTVGAINEANQRDADSVASAMVTLRIIQTSAGDAFSTEVTQYTNTQNAVEKRDFVALDPLQESLRRDLQFDHVDYAYKSGEAGGDFPSRFDLQDATIALACFNDDVALSTIAKGGVGRLWEDIERAPYKQLFNGSLDARTLWQLVQISRAIEETTKSISQSYTGRARLVCVHGNRWIQWLVFQHLKQQGNPSFEAVRPSLHDMTEQAVTLAIKFVDVLFPDSYAANIFKNQRKCRGLAAAVGF